MKLTGWPQVLNSEDMELNVVNLCLPHLMFLGFFSGIGLPEMIIFGLIAVLLFGSRLPSVARSMGRSLTEFKKGMQGIEEEVNQAVYTPPQIDHGADDRQEATAPRFDPPKSEPQADIDKSQNA